MPPQWLGPRVGRRGLVLLLIGALWVLQGVAVWQMPVPPRAPALHEYLPDWLRVAGWAFTGIVGIAAAFFRTPGRDRYGFGALLVMPAERAFSWLGSAALAGDWLVPAPPLWTSVSGFVTWSTVTVLVGVIAGWPEPGSQVIVVSAEAAR